MNAAEPTQAVAATVELDGVRLFTRRTGDGPPVAVLHGGPGAHHDYLRPQYDLRARSRGVAVGMRAPLRGAYGGPQDRPRARRSHSLGPQSHGAGEISPARVRFVRRPVLPGPEPRQADDTVSSNRADPRGGVGEPGRVRPAAAARADRVPLPPSAFFGGARDLRPDAARGRPGAGGAAPHGCPGARHGARAARRGDPRLRAGARWVPAPRVAG